MAACLFPVPLLLAAEARSQPLTLDRVAVDFGTVGLHARRDASLIITNRSERVISLRRTDSDCICLDSRVGAATLGPGESTEWAITLDTCDYAGEVRRHVWLETDQPDLPRLSLPVRYRVAAALFTEPAFLALGLIGESTVEAAIKIRTTGVRPVEIRSVSSRGSQVDAGIVNGRVTPDQPAVVRVFVHPMPEGRFRTSVWVETDSPNMPRLEIPVFGESVRGLRCNRRMIDFENVRLEAREGLTTIFRYEPGLQIGGIRPSNEAVVISSLDRSDGRVSITLAPSENLPLGIFNGFLIVQINGGQPRKIKLPYRGRVVPAAPQHTHVASGDLTCCGESRP